MGRANAVTSPLTQTREEFHRALIAVRTANSNGERFGAGAERILRALASAATPEAISALFEMIEASEDVRLREAAASALGSCAHQLQETDPLRSLQLVQTLLQKLTAATTDEDRLALLSGIANCRSSAALDILDQLLQQASSIVRLQAVKCLRLITDDRADALILRTLQTDAETAVRTSAAFVTSFRRLETMISGLQQTAASDKDPLVRLAALDVLGPAARNRPEVVPALEWLAKNDPDPSVRERSTRFLRKLAS